jgi:PKD repeat protein
VLPITASFTTSSIGYGYAPLTVGFINMSVNADTYLWDFGDGNSSTSANPSHTYQTNGSYTVKLTASSASLSVYTSSISYITVAGGGSSCDFVDGHWVSGYGTAVSSPTNTHNTVTVGGSGQNTYLDYLVSLGTNTGTVTFQWDMFAMANQMQLIYQNTKIFDTGNVSGRGSATFTKTSTYPYLTVRIYGGSHWSFTMSCPS